ncbi:MAG: methyltransferase domain-containing protein [Acidimicrobiales bacterium]
MTGAAPDSSSPGDPGTPRDTYTHGHHPAVLAVHSWRTAENSAGFLLPHLAAGQRLLDVGCGPGTITLDLARRVAPGTVVGIDNAADVIATAHQNAAEAGAQGGGATGQVTFRVGDVYAIDEPDDSFDVVYAHQVLQHLSDPRAALREMRRVCRPGGVVAVRDSDYAGFVWAPLDPRLDRWMSLYHDLARGNGAEPDAGRFLLGWARDAGFTDITAGASAWCFATPADRAWWGNNWADRVSKSAFATQARERGLATQDELDDLADAFRQWTAAPDGYFALLHGELICRP